MFGFSPSIPERFRVLVADDEPDVLAVTKLSLRGFRYAGHDIELLASASGQETIEKMRAFPDIAVLLLDVVMENDTSGLDACRAIRRELGNPFVRILLRTGQPGSAPERQTIDAFDIDGYLPKAELTSTRVYSAVRTALKSYTEIVGLERHRRLLAAVHETVLALRSYSALDETLRRVLTTIVSVLPAPLAVLQLETFDASGNPQRHVHHLATDADAVTAEAHAQEVQSWVARALASGSVREAGPFEPDGFLLPLVVHRELGRGWVYVKARPDDSARQALVVLCAHLENVVYSTVTESALRAPRDLGFDALAV